MWYLLLFILWHTADACPGGLCSSVVGVVEDKLCNGGAWDFDKAELSNNPRSTTTFSYDHCATYCGYMIYNMGTYNPGDTIRHYVSNRKAGGSRGCFCYYTEFTTNNHCENPSNQAGGYEGWYDILYIDTVVGDVDYIDIGPGYCLPDTGTHKISGQTFEDCKILCENSPECSVFAWHETNSCILDLDGTCEDSADSGADTIWTRYKLITPSPPVIAIGSGSGRGQCQTCDLSSYRIGQCSESYHTDHSTSKSLQQCYEYCRDRSSKNFLFDGQDAATQANNKCYCGMLDPRTCTLNTQYAWHMYDIDTFVNGGCASGLECKSPGDLTTNIDYTWAHKGECNTVDNGDTQISKTATTLQGCADACRGEDWGPGDIQKAKGFIFNSVRAIGDRSKCYCESVHSHPNTECGALGADQEWDRYDFDVAWQADYHFAHDSSCAGDDQIRTGAGKTIAQCADDCRGKLVDNSWDNYDSNSIISYVARGFVFHAATGTCYCETAHSDPHSDCTTQGSNGYVRYDFDVPYAFVHYGECRGALVNGYPSTYQSGGPTGGLNTYTDTDNPGTTDAERTENCAVSCRDHSNSAIVGFLLIPSSGRCYCSFQYESTGVTGTTSSWKYADFDSYFTGSLKMNGGSYSIETCASACKDETTLNGKKTMGFAYKHNGGECMCKSQASHPHPDCTPNDDTDWARYDFVNYSPVFEYQHEGRCQDAVVCKVGEICYGIKADMHENAAGDGTVGATIEAEQHPMLLIVDGEPSFIFGGLRSWAFKMMRTDMYGNMVQQGYLGTSSSNPSTITSLEQLTLALWNSANGKHFMIDYNGPTLCSNNKYCVQNPQTLKEIEVQRTSTLLTLKQKDVCNNRFNSYSLTHITDFSELKRACQAQCQEGFQDPSYPNDPTKRASGKAFSVRLIEYDGGCKCAYDDCSAGFDYYNQIESYGVSTTLLTGSTDLEKATQCSRVCMGALIYTTAGVEAAKGFVVGGDSGTQCFCESDSSGDSSECADKVGADYASPTPTYHRAHDSHCLGDSSNPAKTNENTQAYPTGWNDGTLSNTDKTVDKCAEMCAGETWEAPAGTTQVAKGFAYIRATHYICLCESIHSDPHPECGTTLPISPTLNLDVWNRFDFDDIWKRYDFVREGVYETKGYCHPQGVAAYEQFSGGQSGGTVEDWIENCRNGCVAHNDKASHFTFKPLTGRCFCMQEDAGANPHTEHPCETGTTVKSPAAGWTTYTIWNDAAIPDVPGCDHSGVDVRGMGVCISPDAGDEDAGIPSCVNAVALLEEVCSFSGGICEAGKIYFNDGCIPSCVNAMALLEEVCSFSGGICEAGKIYFNDTCISESDLPCGGGEYTSSDGTCVDCQAGRFSTTGGLSCEACPSASGWYQDEVAQSSCKQGSPCENEYAFLEEDCSFSEGTKVCEAGYIFYEGCFLEHDIDCVPGKYMDAQTMLCTDCQAGRFSTDGTLSCKECPTGVDSNDDHTACADDCSAGCPADCNVGEICPNMWGRMKNSTGFTEPLGTLMNPKRLDNDVEGNPVFVIGELNYGVFSMVTFYQNFTMLKSKYIMSTYAHSIDTLTVENYNSHASNEGSSKGFPCDGETHYCAGDFSCDTLATGSDSDRPACNTCNENTDCASGLECKSSGDLTNKTCHWNGVQIPDVPGCKHSGVDVSNTGVCVHRDEDAPLSVCTSSISPLSEPCSYDHVCVAGGGTYKLTMTDSWRNGWHSRANYPYNGTLVYDNLNPAVDEGFLYIDYGEGLKGFTMQHGLASVDVTFTGLITEMFMYFGDYPEDIRWYLSCADPDSHKVKDLPYYCDGRCYPLEVRGYGADSNKKSYHLRRGWTFDDDAYRLTNLVPTCTNATTCTSSTCAVGDIYHDRKCFPNCVPGQYSLDGACTACTDGYQDQAGQTSCKACPSNSASTGTGCQCLDGFSGDECQACAEGQFSSGGDVCQECDAGQFTSDGTACTDCPDGYFQPNVASNSCDVCEHGTHGMTKQTQCFKCLAGQYDSGTCVDCPSGFFSGNGDLSCTACATGKYQDQTGQLSCDVCATGKSQDQTGQSSCDVCATGKYQDQTGQTSCGACATGKSQDQTGQSSCTTCVVGKSQDQTGQLSCTDCDAGKYQDQRREESCKFCAAGKSQAQTGQTSCSDCGAGSYSTQGSSSCTSCATGKYQDKTGQTSCDNCDAGKYSQDGTVCVECTPGTSSTSGSSCTDCGVHTYQDEWGQSSCKSCNGAGVGSVVCGTGTCVPGNYMILGGYTVIAATSGVFVDSGALVYASGGVLSVDSNFILSHKDEKVYLFNDASSPGTRTTAIADNNNIDTVAMSTVTHDSTTTPYLITGTGVGGYGTTKVLKYTGDTWDVLFEQTGSRKYASTHSFSGYHYEKLGEFVSIATNENHEPVIAYTKRNLDSIQYSDTEYYDIFIKKYSGSDWTQEDYHSSIVGIKSIVISNDGSTWAYGRSYSYWAPGGSSWSEIHKVQISRIGSDWLGELTVGNSEILKISSDGNIFASVDTNNKVVIYQHGGGTAWNKLGDTGVEVTNAEKLVLSKDGLAFAHKDGAEWTIYTWSGVWSLSATSFTVGFAFSSDGYVAEVNNVFNRYTIGDATCVACGTGKYQNQIDQIDCISCESGRHQDVTGQAYCKQCVRGKYQGSAGQTTCSDCESGKFQDQYEQSSCSDCDSGKSQSVTGQSSCSACVAGLYSTQGSTSCTACDTGSYSNQGSSSCTVCDAGYYQGQSGQSYCNGCGSGKYTDQTGQAVCKSCSVGKYKASSTKTSCDQCPSGQYQDEEGKYTCKVCTGISFPVSNFTKCGCPGGYGLDGVVCKECGEGTFSNDQYLCEACAEGYNVGLTGQSECIFCGSGQYEKVIGSQECFECPVGYSNYGSASCTACETGKYQPETGKGSCTNCTIGKSQPETGQTSCQDCTFGKFGSQNGQTDCSECETGKYQAQEGQTSCNECEYTEFQDETGKASCEACKPGKYGTTTGQADCNDCGTGKFQDQDGQLSCKGCEVGKSQDETGKTSCTNCTAGTYQSETGKPSCTDCGTGKFQDEDGQLTCKGCDAGKSQDETGKTRCEDCTPGTHQSETNQSSCTYCGTGKYQDQWGQSSCKSCTDAGVGSVVCGTGTGTCPIGKYGSPGNVVVERNLGTHTDDNIKFSPNDAFVFTGKRKLINARTGSAFTTLNADGDMSSATNGVTDWAYWIEGDPSHSSNRGSVKVYKSNGTKTEIFTHTGPYEYHEIRYNTYLDSECGRFVGISAGIGDWTGGYNKDLTIAYSCAVPAGRDGRYEYCYIYIKKYNGDDFTSEKTIDGGMGTIKNMVLSDDSKTLAYVPGSNYMSVYKYGTSWGNVGSFWVNNANIKVSSDGDTIAYVYGGDIIIKKYDGSWSNMGTTGVSYVSDMALSKDGLAFAHKDGTTWTIYTYNGTNWVTGESYSGNGFDFGSVTSKFAVGNDVIKIYASNLAEPCNECAAGRYQNEIDKFECKKCDIGQFQDDEGEGSCKLCAPGKNQNSLGQSSCSACTPGKYQDLYGSSNTCKLCTEGRHGRSGDLVTFDVCEPCEPGFFQDTVGQGSCKSCPVGYYQDDYEKTECKQCDGQYQNQEGQPSCKTCDVGEPINDYTECGCLAGRGLEGTECVDCVAGTFTINEQCEGCPSGFYQNEQKQYNCITCPLGYVDSPGDRSKCTNCPHLDTSHPLYANGSGCPPWSEVVDSCTCDCGSSGFTGGHCDICGEGKGWNNVSGSGAECVSCEYPYVNDQESHDAMCSHDYCLPGKGTTSDEDLWDSSKTSSSGGDNCADCVGITVSPDYYGQCVDIVCEGFTVPLLNRSRIARYATSTDQINCESCPAGKFKNGNECQEQSCPNGFPKDVQIGIYGSEQNCVSCPDGDPFGGACFGPCSAGTGVALETNTYNTGVALETYNWDKMQGYGSSVVGTGGSTIKLYYEHDIPSETGVICNTNAKKDSWGQKYGGTIVGGKCVCNTLSRRWSYNGVYYTQNEQFHGPYCQWMDNDVCYSHYVGSGYSYNPYRIACDEADDNYGVSIGTFLWCKDVVHRDWDSSCQYCQKKCSYVPICSNMQASFDSNTLIQHDQITRDSPCYCGNRRHNYAPPMISDGYCVGGEHIQTNDHRLRRVDHVIDLGDLINARITDVKWFNGNIAVIVHGDVVNMDEKAAYVQLYDTRLRKIAEDECTPGAFSTSDSDLCWELSVDGDKLYVGYSTKVVEYDTGLTHLWTHNVLGRHLAVKNGMIVGADATHIQFNDNPTAVQTDDIHFRADGEYFAYTNAIANRVFIVHKDDVSASVSVEVVSTSLDWFGEFLLVVGSDEVGVYDVMGHKVYSFPVTVTQISASVPHGYPPLSSVIMGDKKLTMECSACPSSYTESMKHVLFTNDGDDAFCRELTCGEENGKQTMVKITDFDNTLDFKDQANCGPCSGYNSGDNCEPIVCEAGSFPHPYGTGNFIIDHSLDPLNQTNCDKCLDTQVAGQGVITDGLKHNMVCKDIICSLGQKINRIDGNAAADNSVNCEDCLGYTVGNRTHCVDIVCPDRYRWKPEGEIDRTLAFDSLSNCGAECTDEEILNAADKTLCITCQGTQVPNSDRRACENVICPAGMSVDVTDNSLPNGDLRNCKDINECLYPGKYPCNGVCVNLVGRYVCNSILKMGEEIESFIDNNAHICPHGFVLSTDRPTTQNKISDELGIFSCPKFETIKEEVVFGHGHVLSRFQPQDNDGVFNDEVCEYTVNKIKLDVEEFSE